MAVVIPPGYAQATLNFSSFTLDGAAACVLGFDVGPAPDLNTLAEAVFQSWENNCEADWSYEFTLDGVELVTTLLAGNSSSPPFPGTRTGDLAPPNVACLVRKNTAHRGPANRGRMFLPGFLNDNDINNSGGITGARRLAIQNCMDGFFGDLFLLDMVPVILHGDGSLDPTPISSFVVEPKIATQRRRLR